MHRLFIGFLLSPIPSPSHLPHHAPLPALSSSLQHIPMHSAAPASSTQQRILAPQPPLPSPPAPPVIPDERDAKGAYIKANIHRSERCLACGKEGRIYRTGPDGMYTLCQSCGCRYRVGTLTIYQDIFGNVTVVAKPGSRKIPIYGFPTIAKERDLTTPAIWPFPSKDEDRVPALVPPSATKCPTCDQTLARATPGTTEASCAPRQAKGEPELLQDSDDGDEGSVDEHNPIRELLDLEPSDDESVIDVAIPQPSAGPSQRPLERSREEAQPRFVTMRASFRGVIKTMTVRMDAPFCALRFEIVDMFEVSEAIAFTYKNLEGRTVTMASDTDARRFYNFVRLLYRQTKTTDVKVIVRTLEG